MLLKGYTVYVIGSLFKGHSLAGDTDGRVASGLLLMRVGDEVVMEVGWRCEGKGRFLARGRVARGYCY